MQKILYLFGELSDDDLDWIIANGAIEKIPPTTALIKEGESADFLYIVLEGSLVVSVTVEGGAKEVTTLGNGEIFGEMSFVDNRPPSATVETLSESLVLSLSRSTLGAHLADDIGFASRFYRAIALFLSSRLRITLSELELGETELNSELELSPVLLNNLPLAQARYDWLLRRVKNAALLNPATV